jgi:hypothetical protein
MRIDINEIEDLMMILEGKLNDYICRNGEFKELPETVKVSLETTHSEIGQHEYGYHSNDEYSN